MSTPSSSSCATPDETVGGMIVSMLFWLCLVLSAALFAMVALSPKLVEHLRLHDLRAANQVKLVSVESQNAQLQRVVDAIQHDKEFATEMMRVEFDAVRKDEEIIPVSPHLKLETRDEEVASVQPSLVPQWHRQWLTKLSTDASLRQSLLITAGLLVVISFTWLQPASTEAGAAQSNATRGPSVWQTLRARYTRTE